MDFAEALGALVPFVDDVYDRWEQDAKQLGESARALHPEVRVTCAKGCGACCHFPIVPVTAGEAFVLLGRLLASGRELSELAATFSSYARAYFAFCARDGGLPFTDARQRRFLAERLPCPLFVKTASDARAAEGASDLPPASSLAGHCGVFPIRPLICDYFHSTEDPALCAAKAPHGSFARVVDRGEAAVEEIRTYERGLFGRSAIGHLPLLLAALCTHEGLSLFLEERELSPEQEEAGEDGQHEADFELFLGLLAAAGYRATPEDLHDLVAAQEEISRRRS